MKLIINENQIKKIINRLINEVDLVNRTSSKTTSKEFPITNSFQSGQFKLINTTEIDNAINNIITDIKNLKNQKFTVYIESSESKVPNRGVGLEPGELSKMRAEEAKKYIANKLPQNTNIIIIDKGVQGPEWEPQKGSKDPEYTKWQYVKLILQAVGDEAIETIAEYCKASYMAKGEYGDPSKGFISKEQVINLGKTMGNITFMFDPVEVPDIFIVEYNGETKTTGFIGTDNEYYRLVIGLILGNYYKDRERPWWLKNYEITQIDNKQAIEILSRNATIVGKEDLSHVFNGLQLDKNTFKTNRLTPYILNQGQISRYNGNNYENSNWALTIQKDVNNETVKVYSVGLIGQTRWTFKISCKQK